MQRAAPLLTACLVVVVVVAVLAAVPAAAVGLAKRTAGTGTCNALCGVPTGFCSDVVTWSACSAGSATDASLLSEASVQSYYGDTTAQLALAAGRALSPQCLREFKWLMCYFSVVACTRNAQSYTRPCKSLCERADATCTACQSELSALSFRFDCKSEATSDCEAADAHSQPCLRAPSSASVALSATFCISVMTAAALVVTLLL